MNRNLKNSIILLVAALFALFIVLACSSSPGGGTASINTEAGSFGSIGILLKDAPADEFQNIYITITEISLLPAGDEGHPLVIFTSESGYTVDLLDLRDQDFLLTLNEQVPAGTYSKVRMKISDINASGGPCRDMDIDLPSGKIDVNPQANFIVEQGEVLYLRLDIDANKSINLHPAGKSDKCIFRPVVFADVIPKGSPATTCSMPYKGIIGSLADVDLDGFPDGFILLREFASQGSLSVNLDAATLIFSEDNNYVTPEALQEGDQVTVYGNVDELGTLNAAFIVIGDVLSVEGVVTGIPAANSVVVLAEPGEEIIGSMNVSLFSQSLILTLCGEVQAFEDIFLGSDVLVMGRYDTLGSTFHANAFLINPVQPY